jgi:hypothetical protein
MMRGFKTFSSRRINETQTDFIFHWQKSFYDCIVRGEQSLFKIQNYIGDNPLDWTLNRNNPSGLYY